MLYHVYTDLFNWGCTYVLSQIALWDLKSRLIETVETHVSGFMHALGHNSSGGGAGVGAGAGGAATMAVANANSQVFAAIDTNTNSSLEADMHRSRLRILTRIKQLEDQMKAHTTISRGGGGGGGGGGGFFFFPIDSNDYGFTVIMR